MLLEDDELQIDEGLNSLHAQTKQCSGEATSDGTEYNHDLEHDHDHGHGHAHSHGHVHDPKEKKRQITRLSRIIGHLEYVKRMLENDEDCSDVLMQLAASKSAMNGLEKSIISEHLSHCIVHAIEDGDTTAIEEFTEAIKKYL